MRQPVLSNGFCKYSSAQLRVKGALLYVKPVLLLLSSYGAASVEDELKNLPKGQDQMYEMVLERISEKAPSPEQPLIKSLLSLVLHVKEPLSFRELQSLYETKTQYSIPKLIKIRCSRYVRLPSLLNPYSNFIQYLLLERTSVR